MQKRLAHHAAAGDSTTSSARKMRSKHTQSRAPQRHERPTPDRDYTVETGQQTKTSNRSNNTWHKSNEQENERLDRQTQS